MPDYELRYLDERGAVRVRHVFAAPDDGHATSLSADAAAGAPAELWRGRVRLAAFNCETGGAQSQAGTRG